MKRSRNVILSVILAFAMIVMPITPVFAIEGPGDGPGDDILMPPIEETQHATVEFLSESLVIQQGQTIQLQYNLVANDNPNPMVDYEILYHPPFVLLTTSVSEEQLPIIQDEGELIIKGYDVGRAWVRIWVTNNDTDEVAEDYIEIEVVLKQDTAYEYGFFGMFDAAQIMQTFVDLEGYYEKLVALAQVVEPHYGPRILLDDGIPKPPPMPDWVVVGNLRNDLISYDNGLHNIRNHEYQLQFGEFSTLYESSVGPDHIRPFNYFAMDAGMLWARADMQQLDEPVHVMMIGVADTTIIDYEDEEYMSMDGINRNADPVPEIHRVYFNNGQSLGFTPIVIAELSSYEGKNYSHARITEVTDSYFDVFIEEWDKHRATDHHFHEYLSYIAVKPGVHVLSNGDTIEAGYAMNPQIELNMTPWIDQNYHRYQTIFDNQPIMFAQTQTHLDHQQVWVSQRPLGYMDMRPVEMGPSVYDDVHGFAYTLMTEVPPHLPEQVGYVAIGQPYTPYPVDIDIEGESNIYVPFAGDPAEVEAYTATVYDQYGYEFDTGGADLIEMIDWMPMVEPPLVQPAWDNALNEITVDQTSMPGTMVLKATFDGLEVEKSVMVHREEAYPTTIELYGPSDVDVPYVDAVDNPREFQYTSKVFDQYGLWMPSIEPIIGAEGLDSSVIFDYTTDKLRLTHLSLAQGILIDASYASDVWDPDVLLYTSMPVEIHRETPAIYNITLSKSGETDMIPTIVYTSPETIDIPYFNDPEQKHMYYARVTDQYGQVMQVDTELFSFEEAVRNVNLNGMDLYVDYNAEVGQMTMWAIAQGQNYMETTVGTMWHFTIDDADKQSNPWVINFVKDELVPTFIELIPDFDNSGPLWVPYEGFEDSYDFEVIIYDQYMDEMDLDGEVVLVPGDTLPTGITMGSTIDNIAEMRLYPSSEPGTFNLVARYQWETDQMTPSDVAAIMSEPVEVTVMKEEPVATRYEITGPSELLVPNNETTNTGDYTIVVFDQYGAPMDVPAFIEMVKPVPFDGVTFEMMGSEDIFFRLSVTSEALHAYVMLYGHLGDLSDPGFDAMYMMTDDFDQDPKVVLLKKSVQITIDDVNNIILGLQDGMEFLPEGRFMSRSESEPFWFWYEEAYPPYFAGNQSVKVRYRARLPEMDRTAPIIIGPFEEYPEEYVPSAEVTVNFTVIPPIIVAPTNTSSTSVSVSLINQEDPAQAVEWIYTNLFYRIGTTGSWTPYTGAFNVSPTVTVYAKTEVTYDDFETDAVTGASAFIPDSLESVIVSKTINYVAPTPGPGPTPEVIIEDLETPLGAVDFYEPYAQGYTDGSFRPKNATTRAELAAMMARILKLDMTSKTAVFKDMKSTDWATPYVEAVRKVGLFTGYSNGMFKPNQAVTKAEFASIMSRYWALLNEKVDAAQAPYDDTAGHWALYAINQVYNSGIMEGFTDNLYRPNSGISREETVIALNRATVRPTYSPETASYQDVMTNYWSFGNIEAATQYFEVNQPIE